VFQQTILSEQEKFRSKGHSSGVQKKPWQHEHWVFAVLTGRGVLLAVLIHNTQLFEQISLTTLTALQAIGFSEYERVPKDTYSVKASVQCKHQFAASIMASLALMPSRNIGTTKIGD
jgi:hypothetical protein